MAFAFVAAGHYDSSGSTTLVVPKPTGTTTGDLMVCFWKRSTDTAVATDLGSAPSGWTQAAVYNETSLYSYQAALYWKVATAGDSGTSDYTWTLTDSARSGATIVTFRDGFNTSDPVDVVSNGEYIAVDTTCRATTMTVSAANSPVIFLGGVHDSGTVTFTAPSFASMTEHVDQNDGGSGSRFNRTAASAIWTSSGATGNIDSTISGSFGGKHAFALALNPAAGGSASSPTVGTLRAVGNQPTLYVSTSSPIAAYNSFKETLGDGTMDLDTHTLKVCVLAATYTPSAAHTQLSEVVANQVGGTTDTALTTVTWAQTSGVAKLDADDTIIQFPSGGTPKYAVLYDDTATNDDLIAYVTLPDSTTISAGSSLKLIWDNTGIVTLD